MLEMSGPFTHSEITQRWIFLRSLCVDSNIDVLLLNSEADVRYVSGFLTPFWQSPTRTWTVLLPQTGSPLAVIPGIGESLMQSSPINTVRCYQSPHPATHAREVLKDALDELRARLHGKQLRVGLPMGAESSLRMPLADWNWLSDACPEIQFIDATDIMQQARVIKSDAEVALIRQAAQSASAAFAQLPGAISAGLSEKEVFRQFRLLALQAGVDDIPYLVGGADVDGYRDIIRPPAERLLRVGDVLVLDTGCTVDGYYCDFNRNFSIGTPSARVQAAYQRVWDATEAGLAAITPGVTFASVFHKMNQVMQPAADSDESSVGRLGHGLGSQLTETPSFTAQENTVIQAGMVLTLEPGYCYGEGQIMVHEENILVTDSGYEMLSVRAAPDIPVVDA